MKNVAAVTEAEWGRADIDAERRGDVVHLTNFAFDGPGRRRRPIDQLHADRVISAKGHAAGERYLDLLAKRTPKLSGSQVDYQPSTPGSRCLTSDERLDARDAVSNAQHAVRDAVGRMGWRMLTETLEGATLASLALTRGYVRGPGAGDARRLHSQVHDAYEALGDYFVEADKARGR